MDYQLMTPSIPLYKNNLTVVEQVFANRGIQPQDVEHYLNPTEKDIVPSEKLKNLELGTKCLLKHISDMDDALIIVDSDCDGYTSAALLINYLHRLFPYWVENHLTYRLHSGKQHGIDMNMVTDNIKLVIVPDAGSNDFKEHLELHDRGVHVIVIDHHEADGDSDFACVINNQFHDYPNPTLSGAGVVYKFCKYIDENLAAPQADDFLDLASVGMIGDMVDLRNLETRYLTKCGLVEFKNPLLAAIREKNAFSIGSEITPFGVSFYVAPLINAMVRSGDQEEKLILFEAMLEHKAYEKILSTKRGHKGEFEYRVEQACRNSGNVRNRQNKNRDINLELVEELIERDNLLDNKILTICPDFNIDKNLTGLIANILMAKYQRPVLLLNRVVHEDTGYISWEGSGRAPTETRVGNFREYYEKLPMVEFATGHAGAFGLGVRHENLQAFIDYTNEDLKDMTFDPCYKVDFIIRANELELYKNNILKLAELKSIWGQGIEEPQIAIENLMITAGNLTLMSKDKHPTLKIRHSSGVDFIKFKASEEEFNSLFSEQGSVIINAIGTCERNIWCGNITLQIIIKDYEIVGRQEYYF